MAAEITATARKQGTKNALICGGGSVVALGILAVGISLVNGEGFVLSWKSLGIAFAASWVTILVLFFGLWLRDRSVSGEVLLDCGPHPTKGVFLMNAITFFAMGVAGGGDFLPVPRMLGNFGAVFGISFGIYFLVMAGGRLQVRENGLWVYWGLMRWDKVVAYEWDNESTLTVRGNGLFSSVMQGAIPVPPEHREAIEGYMRERCSTDIADSQQAL